MHKLNTSKNPAPQDWHNADIKCALEKRGFSLRRLSRLRNYSPGAACIALQIPWPKMEKIIADAIGVPPQTIWPSRYGEDGKSNRRRGGYHPRSNATTAPSAAVIPPSEAE